MQEQRDEKYSGARFEIFQGVNAFIAHEFALLEEMPESSVVSVLGGGGTNYVTAIGAKMGEYESLRNRKKIKVRYISTAAQAEDLKKMAAERENFEYRIFPHLEKGLVDTDIWPNKIRLNFFGEPLLSFTLTSVEIAKSYQQFFEALWKASAQ